MVNNVVCREAGLADRSAVLAIHDNVYDGADYLASYYTSYMHDKWTLSYVAEVDGKVVSFIAHFISNGGHDMVSGGARTSPAYQKKGINQQLSKFAIQQTRLRFPHLQTMYSAGDYKPYADKVEAGLVPCVEVVRRMNFFVYGTCHEDLKATASNLNIDFDNCSPITSRVEEILLSAPNRASLFHEGIIKVQPNWLILAPTDDNIKRAVRCSFTIVTCSEDDSVLAVSFGSVVSTKMHAISSNLELFIDKTINLAGSERHTLCMSHIITHIQHAVHVSGDGNKVSLRLSLPQDIDYEAVRQTLKPHLGEIKAEHHTSFIYKSPYPKD